MPGRVLVVTNDFPPRTGGIESFVLEMTRRLPAGRVVVHTARQEGDASFDAALPFPVVRDPARVLLPTPGVARRVADTARRFGCDAVWFGAAAPLGLLGPALRRGGAQRIVATTHGHEVWWARIPGPAQLLRRIVASSDVVTYLGDFTRAQIAAVLPEELQGRLHRLTPGVDTQVFRPGAGGARVRAALGLSASQPVVVCVSRMVDRKGQDALVEAWPQVLHAVPDAALLLVGDGPRRPHLQRRVADLGIARSVAILGERPWAELPPYVDAGDVFAMPTRTRKGGLEVEGLGIVYLEAAATGLPVVAGNSGGAPDAVRDGETGLVVDGRDHAAIAAALIRLLTDAALRERLGTAGRRWVEQSWQWDDLAARLTAMLELDPLPLDPPPVYAL
ncbi:MAG: glycosyltransferase family 4 protein [Actinomycetales bacterium]